MQPLPMADSRGSISLPNDQTRRQDFAAGGAKSHNGGHIFKIQYLMYAATGGQTWGAQILNGVAGHRWRRPGL